MRKENRNYSQVVNNENSFNEDDRKNLNEVNNTMKLLLQEIQEIKNELSESKEKLKKLQHQSGVLKQAMNLSVTKMDKLEQYGRRENIRIHGVREKNGNKDDGEEVLLDLAKQLKIELNFNDVQRVHRLGKKKVNYVSSS